MYKILSVIITFWIVGLVNAQSLDENSFRERIVDYESKRINLMLPDSYKKMQELIARYDDVAESDTKRRERIRADLIEIESIIDVNYEKIREYFEPSLQILDECEVIGFSQEQQIEYDSIVKMVESAGREAERNKLDKSKEILLEVEDKSTLFKSGLLTQKYLGYLYDQLNIASSVNSDIYFEDLYRYSRRLISISDSIINTDDHFVNNEDSINALISEYNAEVDNILYFLRVASEEWNINNMEEKSRVLKGYYESLNNVGAKLTSYKYLYETKKYKDPYLLGGMIMNGIDEFYRSMSLYADSMYYVDSLYTKLSIDYDLLNEEYQKQIEENEQLEGEQQSRDSGLNKFEESILSIYALPDSIFYVYQDNRSVYVEARIEDLFIEDNSSFYIRDSKYPIALDSMISKIELIKANVGNPLELQVEAHVNDSSNDILNFNNSIAQAKKFCEYVYDEIDPGEINEHRECIENSIGKGNYFPYRRCEGDNPICNNRVVLIMKDILN